MLKRILGLLGWLGVALVFAGARHHVSCRPEWQQWYSGLAIAGLVCTLLYILSQWREIARAFSGRRGALRLAGGRQHRSSCWRSWSRSTTSAARHNKRWDLTSAKQFTLSEQTRKMLQSLDRAGEHQGLRHVGRLRALPRSARRVPVRVASRSRSNTSTRCRRPSLANQYKVEAARHRRLRVRRPHRARHFGRRTGADQRADQGRPGTSSTRSTSSRATASTTSTARIGPATAPSRRRSVRTTTRSTSWCSPSRRKCRPTPPCWSSRDRRPTSSRPRSRCSSAISRAAARCCFLLDPPDRPTRPPLTGAHRAAQGLGDRARQQRRRRRERHGSALRNRRRCRSPPSTTPTRSPTTSA